MKTEGTNLLLLAISALGHLDELQKAEKYLIGWSLQTDFTVVSVGNQYTKTNLVPEIIPVYLLLTNP